MHFFVLSNWLITICHMSYLDWFILNTGLGLLLSTHPLLGYLISLFLPPSTPPCTRSVLSKLFWNDCVLSVWFWSFGTIFSLIFCWCVLCRGWLCTELKFELETRPLDCGTQWLGLLSTFLQDIITPFLDWYHLEIMS